VGNQIRIRRADLVGTGGHGRGEGDGHG
jgi:hypothetical protein